MNPKLNDLEAQIMKRLEEKWGQTMGQLSEHLKTPQREILMALQMLREKNYVSQSNAGVWTMLERDAYDS